MWYQTRKRFAIPGLVTISTELHYLQWGQGKVNAEKTREVATAVQLHAIWTSDLQRYKRLASCSGRLILEERALDGCQSRSRHRKENLLQLPETEQWFFGFPVRSLITIPTELSQLRMLRAGKAVPLQPWTDLLGSRRLRLPQLLDNRDIKAEKLSALCTCRP